MFSIPAGYLFAIPLKQELVGIWEGMMVGSIMQTIAFTYIIVFRVDWAKMAQDINNKMKIVASLIENQASFVNDQSLLVENQKSILLLKQSVTNEDLKKFRTNSHLYDSRYRSLIE